ncbi:MAG TPA: hypothetical protein PKC80_02220 [Burkholderiaceae bacterium]|nr:hypothetical protein [Burkholderiaceae bacterium]
MQAIFEKRRFSSHDIWLTAIVVAAVNMLWPSQGKTYSVRESYTADFLLSNWLILLSIGCVLYFIHLSSEKQADKHQVGTQANSPYSVATPQDWALLVSVFLLSAWPIRHTSTLALSVISFYLLYLLFYRDKQNKTRDYELLAAASILFAISFSRLWSPVLLKVFAVYFEIFDVFLLGKLLNTPTNGNAIQFVFEPEKRAVVVMGCTSFANLSAVVLLWLVVTRWLRTVPRFQIELKALAYLLLTAIAINTTRIALMVTTKDMYDLWHGPMGSSVTTLLLTMSALLFAMWGAKRAN